MAKDVVEYKFNVIDVNQHLGEVEIMVPELQSDELEFKLPVWRSGRYEILDLSKNIADFSAENSAGESLDWQKTDKNTWVVENRGSGKVTIRYQLYANMLKYRVAHIDDSHAFLDASGVFMFTPPLRNNPLTVQLHVPEQWRSRSGMDAIGENQFKAANYDQLVDSPIESGIHEFLDFKVEDRNYEIVIWGRGNQDIMALKEAIEKIDGVAGNLWHTFPFKRYVYIYHVGEGIRGATEHVNSTVIQQARYNFAPRKDYLRVLATTAHEFVHTWNVKNYRPSGISPYDYSQENYSRLFWMVEGSTSYYDDLLLLRAGIYKPEEYFEQMAHGIQSHLNKPGRLNKSVAMSSFDSWLSNDRQFSHNNGVSIYLEGTLKTWALDREIRQRSDHAYSYDDVQRRLYQQFGDNPAGYAEADVLAILKELTGDDMVGFWADYIDGTVALDFKSLLAFYGLKQDFDSDSEVDNWLGFETSAGVNGLEVTTVNRDSPAWKAGLTAGDELLALDGLRVHESTFDEQLKQLKAGQSYGLTFFSGDELKSSEIKPQVNPNPDFEIRPVAKPSRAQKKAFEDWTGISLSDVIDELES